ncbi:MAG TPA: RNA methyltransferase [Thermoanaerobaculia bacterium]|jgi:TrmH family RNA methyltransferase
MKAISSRQNPLFKRVHEAIREHAHEIVIEGPKAVDDAIAAGWKPIAVVRRGEGFTNELFDALTTTKTSQGVIGLFERPKPRDLFRRADSIVVALDGVQDPGNVGTIVRLAAAFACAGVAILPGCADPFGPKAIRASAGAILNVNIAEVAAHTLIESGWPIFGADAAGETIDPPNRRAIIVFGNEGAGISSELRVGAKPIAIRMSARVESLNVAASAAILLSRSYALR